MRRWTQTHWMSRRYLSFKWRSIIKNLPIVSRNCIFNLKRMINICRKSKKISKVDPLICKLLTALPLSARVLILILACSNMLLSSRVKMLILLWLFHQTNWEWKWGRWQSWSEFFSRRFKIYRKILRQRHQTQRRWWTRNYPIFRVNWMSSRKLRWRRTDRLQTPFS